MVAVAIGGKQGQRCLVDSYLVGRVCVAVVGQLREKGSVEYVQGVSGRDHREERGKGGVAWRAGNITSILLLCCERAALRCNQGSCMRGGEEVCYNVCKVCRRQEVCERGRR